MSRREAPVVGRKVLVVEDDLHNRAIVAKLLEMEGFQVLLAVTGVEALEVTRSQRPDVIIMDLSLPIMDGWEATSRLKDDPELAHIPVLAVTAHAMDGDEYVARAAGCDDYVPKPFDPLELIAKVRKYAGV